LHDSGSIRKRLTPATIYELKLENLITSNVFQQGYRIRLQISASFTPNFSRNLQSGKLEVNSAEIKRAHIRVFHDAKHLSQVVLPIIPIAR
jgi:predicted acyl esterase